MAYERDVRPIYHHNDLGRISARYPAEDSLDYIYMANEIK